MSIIDSDNEENKDIVKSNVLLSVIVEDILIQCIDSCNMEELFKIQRKFKLQKTLLKQYLFYLIEFRFVSYDGQDHIFKTQKIGWQLLFVIKFKNRF